MKTRKNLKSIFFQSLFSTSQSQNFLKYFFLQKKGKNTFLLVFQYKDDTIRPELSSPPRFRIQGGTPNKGWTEIHWMQCKKPQLCKNLFLKESRKTANNSNLKKNSICCSFFFIFFTNGTLQRAELFCVAFSA